MRAVAAAAAGLALLIAGCTGQQGGGDTASRSTAPPEPDRLAYSCADGRGFEARYRDDQVVVRIGDERYELSRIESGSGAKYRGAAPDGGRVLLHTKGRKAYLELPGLTYEGCEGTPVADAWQSAKVRGIELRALGQEPGWWLELDRGRRTLVVLDYGARSAAFPAPPAQVDAVLRRPDGVGRAQLASGGHTLTLTVRDGGCRDVMSGQAHPLRVSIALDDRRYEGCGRAL